MQQPLPLRDIHLPDGVSWFPPAPGWWLLLALIAASIVLVRLWRRRTRRPVINKRAKAEFERIVADYNQHQDQLRLLQEQSALLKRIGMSYLGREQSAGAFGIDWVRQVSALAPEGQLEDSGIALLADAPYCKTVTIGDDELQNLIAQLRRWIAGLPASPGVDNV